MRFNRKKYTNIVMHCDKKWKAEIFCNYMNKINKALKLNHVFTTNDWKITKGETCYNVYNGVTDFRGRFLSYKTVTILEFDDFDWYYNPTVVNHVTPGRITCPKCGTKIALQNKSLFNLDE